MAHAMARTLTPLLILRILEQHGDERHPLTREFIEGILDREYGITLERKAFFRHIEHLNELDDVDIRRVTVKSSDPEKKACAGFYLVDRAFSDMELRLIIDSLSGNFFISEIETQELIDRVAGLSSKYFKKKIAHYKFMNNRGKTTNSTILYNLELIEDAIEQKKKIVFNPVRTGKTGKKETSVYFRAPMTPVQTLAKGQSYYLLYLFDGKLASYPITGMANVEIVEEPAENLPEYLKNGIDYNQLLREHPDLMRIQHKAELCIFHCERWMLDAIKAHFGTELRVSPIQHHRTVTYRDGTQEEVEEDLLEVSVLTDSSSAMEFAVKHLDGVWLISPDHTNRVIRRRVERQLGYYQYLEDTYGAGIPPKVLKDRQERELNQSKYDAILLKK